jgi:23S rRNA (uracil1939-C5)-methyltransferase
MAESGTNREVVVEKLIYGGEGLSRVDGQVVLTPFVLAGERAEVALEERKPGFARARLVRVNAAAPERVEPPCPYFGRCGGCHYQHASYDTQLETKRRILAETLSRVGKIAAPDPIGVMAGEAWQYRNRAQFHIRGVELGYREARSRSLCAITQCPISSPKINSVIAVLREMLRDRRWPRFIESLEVFTNERDVQINVLESSRPVARRFFEWCAERIEGFVAGALDYSAVGHLYRVSPKSFFQVNRHLVDALAQAALDGLNGESAADLFAGVGLFSLPLRRRFREVTAVESGASAARDLTFNAERAGLPVRIERSSAEVFLARLDRAPDCVVLDPPRAGMGKAVVERLLSLRPRRVVIVACDPATLARDLRPLLEGGFGIERMAMADLFPQTFHLETIAHLAARA